MAHDPYRVRIGVRPASIPVDRGRQTARTLAFHPFLGAAWIVLPFQDYKEWEGVAKGDGESRVHSRLRSLRPGRKGREGSQDERVHQRREP